MIIEQTLHGYNKGHGLLASSFPMKPTEDSSLMAYLSDWTGYRDESEEDSYMTFYPLEQGKRYAFAKTWYAPEMERPGCVWTHTLIIDLDQFDRNLDFRVLKQYFRRPTNGNFEEYTHKIEVDNYPKCDSREIFEKIEGTSILFLFLFLISENSNLVLYMEQEQEIYADLCFYYLQYLPIKILQKTALTTGAVAYRKFGNKDFSIQFTNNSSYLSLSNNPWNGKLTMDDFDEGLKYIYTESQKENDQLPSLIRLFSDDIDSKDKYVAFALLMKKLDIVLSKDESISYTEILDILGKYFPNNEDGELVKYNFTSQKISNLFSNEKDVLYQIASLENDTFLNQDYVNFGSRIISLDKDEHSDFIDLINSIVKLSKFNNFAGEAIEYSIDTLDEQELLDFISMNWETIYDLLSCNERFLKSEIWLKLQADQLQTILPLFSDSYLDMIQTWRPVLDRIIELEIQASENIANRIVNNIGNAVEIILDAANSSKYAYISSYLIYACIPKLDNVLEWLERQNCINKRIETFFLDCINPNDSIVKKYSSAIWNALKNIDNDKKTIEYYIYLYMLAHNWKSSMAVSLLKQSFTHIYVELSKNTLDDKLWERIKEYTSSSYKIDKWDKCKILSYGLVDYLKECDFTVKELKHFSNKDKLNERLIHIWEKR